MNIFFKIDESLVHIYVRLLDYEKKVFEFANGKFHRMELVELIELADDRAARNLISGKIIFLGPHI
jgi:hypothetical protein